MMWERVFIIIPKTVCERKYIFERSQSRAIISILIASINLTILIRECSRAFRLPISTYWQVLRSTLCSRFIEKACESVREEEDKGKRRKTKGTELDVVLAQDGKGRRLWRKDRKKEDGGRTVAIVYSENEDSSGYKRSRAFLLLGKSSRLRLIPVVRKEAKGAPGPSGDERESGTYKMKTRTEMIKLRIFLAYAGIKGEVFREMECTLSGW